jgi:hypothetical protein
MGGPLHPASPGGASFELERLELDRGRLVVSGWWFGVRGMRFLRPALVVKGGRKVLATLEHKPWATSSDGVWTAAFPWKEGTELDVAEVTLVVAPSVEVPLDRTAIEAEVSSSPSPATEPIDIPDPRQPLRDELQALERQLAELREALAVDAKREARGRALEQEAGVEGEARGRQIGQAAAGEREARGRQIGQAAAGEREARGRRLEEAPTGEREAPGAGPASGGELARSHAMVVLDRDRAHAQREEAVVDREAAVRARTRMEAQRDEALAQREAAQAGREEAIAQRDDACRQRDEILLAHRALEGRLEGAWARAARTQPLADAEEPPQAGHEPTQSLRPTEPARPPHATEPARLLRPTEPSRLLRADELWRPNPGARAQKALGARAMPVARAVAAHLQRVWRALDDDTSPGLWTIRILAAVAALSFIWLVAAMLRAFFAF